MSMFLAGISICVAAFFVWGWYHAMKEKIALANQPVTLNDIWVLLDGDPAVDANIDDVINLINERFK